MHEGAGVLAHADVHAWSWNEPEPESVHAERRRPTRCKYANAFRPRETR